ncbi:MAG: hypothetical protein V2A69_04255 [Pseudomonadota bacterium]
MLRRYILIINFFLIIVSLFLVNKIYDVWKPTGHPKESAPSVKETKPALPTLTMAEQKKIPRKAYQVIVDKDLFRPERTEWKPDVQTEQAKVAAAAAPQLKVFGIVISEGFKHAWVQEEGKAEKVKRISEGDELSGWKVSNIEFNTVSVTNGKQTVKFNLIEPGKPKARTVPKSLTHPPQPAPPPQQQRPVPPQQQRPVTPQQPRPVAPPPQPPRPFPLQPTVINK